MPATHESVSAGWEAGDPPQAATLHAPAGPLSVERQGPPVYASRPIQAADQQYLDALYRAIDRAGTARVSTEHRPERPQLETAGSRSTNVEPLPSDDVTVTSPP
jgi:hypothetical protein